MDEHLIIHALQTFGYVPKQIELITFKSDRSVWKVTTDERVFALKLVECSRAQRIAAISRYLNNKGLTVISAFLSRTNNPVVSVNDKCFLLFPWIEGERPKYTDPGMAHRITALLAQYHTYSRGYVSTGGPVEDRLSEWTNHYAKQIVQLDTLQIMASQSKDAFSRLFAEQYRWLYARVNWVIGKQLDSSYENLVAQARRDPLLRHGDYSRGNLLLDSQGNLTIIDLDTANIALPVWDLSLLITRIIRDFKRWDDQRFRQLVQSYETVRQLQEEEKEILVIDQVFPQQAISLASKYYEEAKSKSMLERFERCIAIDKEKLLDFKIGLS